MNAVLKIHGLSTSLALHLQHIICISCWEFMLLFSWHDNFNKFLSASRINNHVLSNCFTERETVGEERRAEEGHGRHVLMTKAREHVPALPRRCFLRNLSGVTGVPKMCHCLNLPWMNIVLIIQYWQCKWSLWNVKGITTEWCTKFCNTNKSILRLLNWLLKRKEHNNNVWKNFKLSLFNFAYESTR